MRAPKEVLHKLQFFVELLHGGVCGAEFVEQSQTGPNFDLAKHVFADTSGPYAAKNLLSAF